MVGDALSGAVAELVPVGSIVFKVGFDAAGTSGLYWLG